MSRKAILLVIDYDSSHDWYAAFKAHAGWLQIEQTAWSLISLAASEETCIVDIAPSPDPILFSSQKRARRVEPDAVLVRNVCRGVHGADYRHLLYGLHYSGKLLSVNSFTSMLAFQERAVVYAELNRLRRAHGAAVFPFIKTSFHPNLDESLIIDPPLDGAEVASSGGARGGVVVKSGTTCAGYGKMRLTSESDFIDFKTTLSMGSDYFTVERAVEVVADLRVQIVGDTTRVYKRSSDTWKGNMGNVTYEHDVEITPFLRQCGEIARGMFGGLDICSVDLLEQSDGTHVILEVNDSATGFNGTNADADVATVVQLVVNKMVAAGLDLQLVSSTETLHSMSSGGVQSDAVRTARVGLVAALSGAGGVPGLHRTSRKKKKTKTKKKTAVAANSGGAREKRGSLDHPSAEADLAYALRNESSGINVKPRLSHMLHDPANDGLTPRSGTPMMFSMEEGEYAEGGSPRLAAMEGGVTTPTMSSLESSSSSSTRGYTAKWIDGSPVQTRQRVSKLRSLSFDSDVDFTQMTALEAKRERARLHERRGRSPSHSFEDLDDDDALEGSFSIEIKPKSDEEEGSFTIDMDGGDDARDDPDRHLSDMAALAITPIFDYVDQDDSDTEYVEQTEAASYSAAAVYSLPSSYQDDRGVLSPASHLMAAQRVATNLQHGHVGSPPTDAQSPPHVQQGNLSSARLRRASLQNIVPARSPI